MFNVSMIKKLARYVPANFKVSMYIPTALVKKNLASRLKSCNDADVRNSAACFVRLIENVKSPFVKLKLARKTGTQNSIYAMKMSAGKKMLVKGAYSHVDDVYKGRLSVGNNGRLLQANGFIDEAAETIQTELPIPHINNNWTAMIVDGGAAGRLSFSGNSLLMKPIIGDALRSFCGRA